MTGKIQGAKLPGAFDGTERLVPSEIVHYLGAPLRSVFMRMKASEWLADGYQRHQRTAQGAEGESGGSGLARFG